VAVYPFFGGCPKPHFRHPMKREWLTPVYLASLKYFIIKPRKIKIFLFSKKIPRKFREYSEKIPRIFRENSEKHFLKRKENWNSRWSLWVCVT
jgi:hypothetical protein